MKTLHNRKAELYEASRRRLEQLQSIKHSQDSGVSVTMLRIILASLEKESARKECQMHSCQEVAIAVCRTLFYLHKVQIAQSAQSPRMMEIQCYRKSGTAFQNAGVLVRIPLQAPLSPLNRISLIHPARRTLLLRQQKCLLSLNIQDPKRLFLPVQTSAPILLSPQTRPNAPNYINIVKFT